MATLLSSVFGIRRIGSFLSLFTFSLYWDSSHWDDILLLPMSEVPNIQRVRKGISGELEEFRIRREKEDEQIRRVRPGSPMHCAYAYVHILCRYVSVCIDMYKPPSKPTFTYIHRGEFWYTL
jgi:hypothetical protein